MRFKIQLMDDDGTILHQIHSGLDGVQWEASIGMEVIADGYAVREYDLRCKNRRLPD